MKKVRIGVLVVALLIPLLVGGISAALSAQGMTAYQTMNKPPLSPPAWVFSVAWTILYLVMGLASYFVFVTEDGGQRKMGVLCIYGISLALNFMWSIIFFNWLAYLGAFIWLLILWCTVILCAFGFYKVNKIAGLMMIPYIMWLTFAAYLNLGAYILQI